MGVEDIKKIGVVGAGVMGHGIAQVCARNGFEVILVDVSEDILRKALELIESGPFGLQKLVEKGKLSRDEVKVIMNRIKTTVNYKDLSGADFIIEAVPERVDLKKKVFSKLDEICKESAVFASNTSGILITELASAVKRKDKFIGMHWFNPAPVMKLIEVVKGTLTSEETLNLTVELSKKLGKIPIVVNDAPGFFTTRYIAYYLAEAIRLFEQGIAGIKEIDEMCKLGFGWPMGPFKLMDLIGLDTVLHILEYLHSELGYPEYSPPITLKKLVLSGYLGDKSGSLGGWYKYYNIK